MADKPGSIIIERGGHLHLHLPPGGAELRIVSKQLNGLAAEVVEEVQPVVAVEPGFYAGGPPTVDDFPEDRTMHREWFAAIQSDLPNLQSYRDIAFLVAKHATSDGWCPYAAKELAKLAKKEPLLQKGWSRSHISKVLLECADANWLADYNGPQGRVDYKLHFPSKSELNPEPTDLDAETLRKPSHTRAKVGERVCRRKAWPEPIEQIFNREHFINVNSKKLVKLSHHQRAIWPILVELADEKGIITKTSKEIAALIIVRGLLDKCDPATVVRCKDQIAKQGFGIRLGKSKFQLLNNRV